MARVHAPDYLAFLAQAWDDWVSQDPANAKFDALPSVWPLVVPLGLDTFEGDPISGFKLRSADYLQLGHAIAQLGLPTVLTFEGGYAVAQVGVNTVNVLEGLLGWQTVHSSSAPPRRTSRCRPTKTASHGGRRLQPQKAALRTATNQP